MLAAGSLENTPDFIARRVSITIVDLFEFVQVDRQNCQSSLEMSPFIVFGFHFSFCFHF